MTPIPGVYIDDGQFQQVMINLLVNAADAIGNKGGKITLTTGTEEYQRKDHVKIRIADTGSGIAKENLSKIFEPFFSTKDQKGTGLGLSVVWGIIEKHRGVISVDSAPNKGSTFTILLPVNQDSLLVRKDQKHA